MRHLLAVCLCLVLGGVLVYPVLKPIGDALAKLVECQKARK